MKKNAIILTVPAKRALCLILILAILAAMLVLPTWDRTVAATTGVYNGFVWELVNGGTEVKITGFRAEEHTATETSILEIPATFSSMTSLYTVTVIGEEAFSGSTMSSIIIPDTVITIEEFAFASIASLTSLTIGSNVNTIGDWAFAGCGELEVVVLPDKLETIGEAAFADTGLTSITIPGGVETIGDFAFVHCIALSSVTIMPGVHTIGFGAFQSCTALTEVTIPNTVTTIRGTAFAYCESLDEVEIPNGVTEIGDSAFAGTVLTSIEIPDSVTILGSWAFSDCESLADVTIGSGILEIGAGTFSGCINLESIIIPNNVTVIGGNAFAETALEDIEIPSSVTIIGESAFYECTSLESVYIHGSLDSIGGSAFASCTSLETVVIKGSVDTIDHEAFRNCRRLITVTIEGDVGEIGYDAFNGCSSLETVTIEGDVGTIDRSAFVVCEALKTVIIRGDVGIIGWGAFAGCKALGTVEIDGSINTIDEFAFQNCISLTSISLDGIETIGYGAFSYCSNLNNVIVPSSVNSISIGARAFEHCTGLTNLIIEDGVVSIGDYAFLGTALTRISIPGSVTTIGESAFSQCEDLEELTIGCGVKTIGHNAFSGTALETVTIPESVVSIGDNAFSTIGTLRDVFFEGMEAPGLGNNVFDGANTSLAIIIPHGADGYDGPNWDAYGSITEKRFMVFIDEDIKNGTITAFPHTLVEENEKVILTIDEAPGYQLDEDSLKYEDSDGEIVPITYDGTDYSFDMPEANVTITAVFDDGSSGGPQDITSVPAFMITAPVAGAPPQAALQPPGGSTGFNVTLFSWYTEDNVQHTGNFDPGTVYIAKATLTSLTGYQWPDPPPTITVSNAPPPTNVSVTGTGTANTLSFSVQFPATNVPVTGIIVTSQGDVDAITGDGGTLQMYAEVLPANATIGTVTWSVTSDGTGSANVNEATGLLTAVANGTVTVRASAKDTSGVYGELNIEISGQITPPNTHLVTVVSNGTGKTPNANHAVGTTVDINAGTLSGHQFTGWTSDILGLVFADATSAITTFIMPDNPVTVTAHFEPLEKTVTVGPQVGNLEEGTAGTATFLVTTNNIAPGLAIMLNGAGSIEGIDYSPTTTSTSGNTTTVTISTSTATPQGEHQLSFAIDGVTGNFTLKVDPDPSSDLIPVTGIAVSSAGGVTEIAPGDTLQMTAAITPPNATNQAVTWTLDPPAGVASFNIPTRTLTAISEGTVKVRATSDENTAIFHELEITVTGQQAGTPTAPQNFEAIPSNGRVTLLWTAPTYNGGSAITGYQVSSDNGTTWTVAEPDPDSNIGHIFTGLTNGQSYTFRVRAVNAAGIEGSAATVSATPMTVPTAPQNFTATPGNGQVALSWQEPANNGGSPIIHYNVTRNDWASREEVTNGTSYTFTGLTNGTEYTFRMHAVNAAGMSVQVSTTATPQATPSITLHPEDRNITAGQNATFTVHASGSAPLTYQWQHRASSSVQQWTNLGSATSNNSLTLETVNHLADNTQYRVIVKDSAGLITESDIATLWVLEITTTASLPNGAVGTAYTPRTLAASGSTPITWSIASGTLPDGLSLSSSTGVISGTPTAVGQYNFRVRATNTAGSVVRDFTINISSRVINITTQPAANTSVVQGSISGSLSVVATATPAATLSYRWYVSTTSSTAGYTDTNVTTATFTIPTNLTPGTYYYYCVVSAQGATSIPSDFATVTVAPAGSPVITTTSPLPQGTIGTPYNQTISATSTTTATVTWSISSGSLPTGLSLSTAGRLTGTPTVAGTFNFTVMAQSSYGSSYSNYREFSLTINQSSSTTSVTVTSISQINGQPNETNSTGIRIVFNQAVTGLNDSHITITSNSGSAVKGTLTPVSGTTYTLTLPKINAQGFITVSIANFGTFSVFNSTHNVEVFRVVYGDLARRALQPGYEGLNYSDLILMFRYFSQPSVSINVAAADVNGDGRVDTADLVHFMRYFARPPGEVILGPRP